MTSWSGGVRTGGWRVKNRSKFSAFRPHYERGEKNLWWVGKKQNKIKPKSKINQNWTEPGVIFLQSLPFQKRRETVSMIQNESNVKCRILMAFATRAWAPSLWVLKLLGHSWFPFGKSGNVIQRHEEAGLAACGISPPYHPPQMSQTRPSVERHGIKVLPIFNGCQMSNNDPFIHHLAGSISLAADPLKYPPAALDQEL